MFVRMLLWLGAIATFAIASTAGYEMNMTQYFKMPNLYNFDDYDRCLQEFHQLSTYCFVRADILPQNDSEAWQAVVEISKYYKHHFNHRHLYFGMCVRWCKEDLANMKDASALDQLYAGTLTNNSKVNTYLRLFAAEDGNRKQYNRLLNQCVNLKLAEPYGLKAESVVEYCDTNHKVIVEDAWNLTFYSVLCVLVLLVTLSSFYDLYLKHKRSDKALAEGDHYKVPIKHKFSKFFVIFSIARNWYRLNQEPNGKLGRDLRFLDCFKFFCMFLVVFAHTNWIIYEGAISNPQDSERMLHTIVGTLLVSGGLITITFFVISGLLLTINWLALTKVKRDLTGLEYLEAFIKFNVFRYIRLTAPYAFVVLLSGVYFDSPGGPLWRHIIEREQLSCRKNWWANLLYINTFVNNNERCMLQSWYLVADTYSFVFSLLLLMIANKWPRARNYLFGGVAALFYFIPGIMTYVKQTEAIFLPSPQTQKDSFIDDRLFSELYTPFHMNFGSYFCGVVAALVYDQISIKQFQPHKYKAFQIVWYALLPCGVLWLFSAHSLFQHYYAVPPRFWSSVYATMQRNTWAFALAFFVLGMACKVGWIFRKFACLPIFKVLGRLTYGAYIIHIFVVRIVLGTIRQPIFFGSGMMFAFVMFTMSMAYLLSLILAVLLELPVSALLKLLRRSQ